MSTLKKMIMNYKKENIVAFSCNIEMNDKFKKVPRFPSGYASFDLNTELKDRYTEGYNSIALRCGSISGIFVVDVDDKEKFEKYLKERERKLPNTTTVETKKGYHLYFKYEERFDSIVSNTGLYDCFDIRSNNSVVFAAGSSYMAKYETEDGTIEESEFKYDWKKYSLFEYELSELPEWLYQDIINWKDTKTTKKITTSKPKKELDQKPVDKSNIDIESDIIVTLEELRDVTMLLSKERASSYSSWRDVSFALAYKGEQNNFSIFNEFSKKADNYDEAGVRKQWNISMRATSEFPYIYKSIYKWAKEDNENDEEIFNKILDKYNENEEKEITFKNTENYQQEYLTTENSQLYNSAINYFDKNNKTKVLLLKSQYGTGKTSLISNFIGSNVSEEFKALQGDNTDSILFVTYRQSLAHSFSHTFNEFKNYLEFDKTADLTKESKLIIQIDSLHRILSSEIKYKYIILDEIESIINHFSAATLKSPSTVYKHLLKLCKEANKVIMLDGDISNRSKTMAKQITNEDNILLINNNYNKITYNFHLVSDVDYFINDIKRKVQAGKNVAIVSMSKKATEQYYKELKSLVNPDEIVMYTSQVSEKVKKTLLDVNTNWLSKRILIYSSVVEAGISFDHTHFNYLYVSISAGDRLKYACCSERSLFQMISRIRHVESSDVLVFKGRLSFNDHIKPKTVSTIRKKYSAIYELCKNDCKEYINILCYNKQEELNKLAPTFLSNFKRMAYKKGHKLYCKVTGLKLLPTLKQESNEFISKLPTDIEEDDEQLPQKLEKIYTRREFNMDFNDVDEVQKYYSKVSSLDLHKKLINYIKNDTFNTFQKSYTDIEQQHNLKILVQLFDMVNPNWKTELKTTGKFSIVSSNVKDNGKNIKREIGDFVCKNLIFFGLPHKKCIESWVSFLGSFKNIIDHFMLLSSNVNSTTREGRKTDRTVTFVELDLYLYSKLYGEEFLN